MTILHIITRLILGGAQQNTVLCCAGQVAAGHRVVLVFGPIYGPEGSLRDQALASGAELIEVPTLRRSVLPWHDVRCYLALRRIIREVKPDVVHTHSSKAGILGRAAAWAQRVPVVIHTIHGSPFHERQSAMVRHAYIAAERWAARRCHKLVGVTQLNCDNYLAQHIGRPEQYTVVPSGVDLDAFERITITQEQARAQWNIEPNAQVIGIVARLDELKGQDDLLDIFPQLLQTHPAAHLLFVGEGWHGQALRQRVASQTWANRVTFTGLIPPERVGCAMRAMDVCALPSYQEGQPRVLVQALMSGVSIVGYAAGGIGEVCIDNQTGLLVPRGDRNALLNAIRQLLDHPDERRRLVMQGKQLAREKFDLRIMLERLERLYAQIPAKTRAM